MSKKEDISDTTLHPSVFGRCVSVIRNIMRDNELNFEEAFNLFKTEELKKTFPLKIYPEELFESNKDKIENRIMENESGNKNEEIQEGLNWWAIGHSAKKIIEIMTREKQTFQEAFEGFRNTLFKDSFKKYSIEDLDNSRELIEEKVKESLPASFSPDDSLDIQYSKGGKKRFVKLEDIDKIDLTDVHLVLKELKEIITTKYGEKEKKIKIGQMDNTTSMKRLPKHSYSMIFSFKDLESRDDFLMSEEFRLLSGALLAAASRYNNKESLSVLIP